MFWYFEKKTHIFTRRIVCALFHDAKFGHTLININKLLNWNVLQYTILYLQSILSVYLNINTNFQLSTFYHTKEALLLCYYSMVVSLVIIDFSAVLLSLKSPFPHLLYCSHILTYFLQVAERLFWTRLVDLQAIFWTRLVDLQAIFWTRLVDLQAIFAILIRQHKYK